MSSEATRLQAANDNPGGPTTIDTAIFAFVTTLARAYAQKLIAHQEAAND